MLGPQGNTKQHISPHNAHKTPTIVGTASTGLAPLARMERYLVDRDLPVRRILALVTATAIIPTDAPLAPIEIEIPLWKLRRVTHDQGRVVLRSLLAARLSSGQAELGRDRVIAANVQLAPVISGRCAKETLWPTTASWRIRTRALRNQMMATERYFRRDQFY